MARPSLYSQAIVDEICERLAAGESLRKICKRTAMPGLSTVIRWLADPAHDTFRAQYARAREAQADTLADEILAIADATQMGTVTTTRRTGEGAAQTEETETKRGDMLGHRRLQIDARKWLAGKLAPKKYGDKLELGGEVNFKRVLSEPMTEEEWAARHASSQGD